MAVGRNRLCSATSQRVIYERDCRQKEISQHLLVSEKMHFDGAAGTVDGGVEGFCRIFKGKSVSYKGFSNMWIP